MKPVLLLTFQQCQDAARAARRAEHGPAAIRQLRCEPVLGFFRQRPRLALLLYLRAAQGRLVWQSPNAFAILEPPGGDPFRVGRGPRARWAGRIEVAWPILRDWGLPALLTAALVIFALFGGRNGRLVVIFGGSLLMLYLLSRVAYNAIRRLFLMGPRSAGRWKRRAWAEGVLYRNWSVGLLHAADLAAMEALLCDCHERAVELDADAEYADGVLVCRVGVVTTAAAWAAVTATTVAYQVQGAHEATVVVRIPGNRPPEPLTKEKEFRSPAAWLVVLAAAFATWVLIITALASSIVDLERRIYGRPAVFFDVLAWLFDQAWLFGDLGTIPPPSPLSRMGGVITQALTMAVVVLFLRVGFAAYQAYREKAQKGTDVVNEIGPVFLSHRKGPHRELVMALRRDLAVRLGEDRVFMDYRSMSLDAPCPGESDGALRRCRVLLAIIHDGWMDDLCQAAEGSDWVHYEIATALELGKVVIAVYFDDAQRLDAKNLPKDISELALRQDCRVRWNGGNLDDDLDRLAREVAAAAASPG